jgi:hypothetical protein
VVATLKHDEDVYVALRDAFDSVRRRLEEAGAEDAQARRVGLDKHHL